MGDYRMDLRFHPAMLATLVMVVMMAFALGYHNGVKTWERDFLRKYEQSQGQERHATGMLETCASELLFLSRNVSSKNQTIQSVLMGNAKIEEEIKKLVSEFMSVTDETDKCRVEIRSVTDGENLDDKSPHEDVKAMMDELRTLYNVLSGLTENDGMRRVDVYKYLEGMRNKSKRFCSNIPGCTLPSDASLLQRWKEVLENSWRERTLKETDLKNKMKWKFNAENPEDKEAIYFPVRNEATAPTYFGRKGNPPLFLGNEADSRVVVSTAMERLFLLKKFALCAYRTNNASITFPSMFQWDAESERTIAVLQDLVETPLVTFCMDCTDPTDSTVFLQKCLNESEEISLYGNRDYWAMRSMIVPHPDLDREASNFYTANSLVGRRVLAVVAHNSVHDCLRSRDDPRGNHFLYLLANFPDEVPRFERHVSNDVLYQCAPTAAQLLQHITRVMEDKLADKAESGFEAVYISVPSDMKRELKSIENKPAWWDTAVFSPSDVLNAHDEVLDLIIASKADGVLLSPFFNSSEYVLDSFLLRHELRPMGNIWFF